MNLFKERQLISVSKHQLDSCDLTDYPDNFEGSDEKWDVDKFKKNFKIIIYQHDDNFLEFDLIGIEAPIVNAFRRILIAEIPTMAIDKVFIYNNTSIFQDDFLAHRLGQIPIKIDPRLFQMRKENDKEGTPKDTIELILKVKCTKNNDAPKDATTPEELYLNRNVYTRHIEWNPIGDQTSFIKKPIKPVDDDILIAKLSPGQELDLMLHCLKGIGRDHAKFSPVATASYRLLPSIQLTKPIVGEDAELLVKCFSKGVIETKVVNNETVAEVVNPRLDSLSRNCFRYKQFEDKVKISLVKNHFIFTIESTGILSPDVLFLESVKLLSTKCKNLLNELQELVKQI